MDNKYKTIKKYWIEAAALWKKVKPTYKPSKVEIFYFERFLKQILHKNLRVLVLGATPEIRKMLVRHKVSVTLLDNNPIMVKAMNSLIPKRLKNPREKVVTGGWLKMPFADNSFDVILSDHPTSSILYKDFSRFFKELARVLDKDGHFIIDIHMNAKLKPVTLNDYINKYQKNKKWWKNFDNQVLTQYQCIMGGSEYYNKKTYRSKWGKMDRELRKLYEKGKLTKGDYKNLIAGLGEHYVFTFPSQSACSKVIKKYFTIKKAFHIPNHPVYKYYCLYFCKKI